MARLGRFAAISSALAGAWLFLDLYLRIDLPLAAGLQSLVFRSAALAVEWMHEGGGGRPATVLAVLAAAGLVAAIPGRLTAPLRSASGVVLLAGQLAAIVIASLMERGLSAGALAGAALGILVVERKRARQEGARDGTGAGRGHGPTRRPTPRARIWTTARALAAILAGGAGWLYLAELFAARSDGYQVVEWLGARAAAGVPLAGIWLLLSAALAIGVALVLRRLAGCAVIGVVVALALGLRFDPGLPVASAIAGGAAGALLLLASWRPLVAAAPDRRWDPATWAWRALPAALVAWLLIGHTYAVRVFGCGQVAGHPAVTRVAAPGEVFRLALGDLGAVGVLALRSERRFGRLDLQPAPGSLGFADPGPVPAPPADWGTVLPGTSLASSEELLWAPAARRFYGTVLGGHPDFYSLPASPPGTVHNLLVTLSADGWRVERAVGIEHLCWIGAMAWHDGERRLYLGCEYEPALHRYDPESGVIEATMRDERIGDVAAIAIDPTPGSDRIFTVSFWRSQSVAEIERSTMAVRARRDVGGAHYDMVFDPAGDRLFVSAFYGSRIRILRGSGLAPIGRIPTGLGARALALDRRRDLLLASSVYDGALTVCRASTGGRLAWLHVGGHVKDIAVDEERGLAWLSSRCGMFRVDMEALVSGPGRSPAPAP